MTAPDPTEARLALHANGYTPLPSVAKSCYLRGWPTLRVTEELIRGWAERKSPARRFQDTGIRVENGLCVLDLDIDHKVADDIADQLEEEEPLLRQALLRFGKGYKRAWFFRIDEPFGRIASRRWLAPDAVLDRDGTQCVEAFGGAAPRQFGFGPGHTRNSDGSIEVTYEWVGGQTPVTTRLADLPEITKAKLFKLVDLVESALLEAGWTVMVRTVKGEQTAARAYDLTPEMRFECNDGITRDLEALHAAAGEPGLRCSASWLEPGATNRERCLVGKTGRGEVSIFETASGVTHLPLTSKRPSMAQVRERMRDIKSPWLTELAL